MSLPELLCTEARRLLDRAYVPYSRLPAAAVVLLSDGALVPGVRVENASFSLSIAPAHAAVATAVALGRLDVCAVAVYPESTPMERLFLASLPFAPLLDAGAGRFFSGMGTLPMPGSVLSLPTLPKPRPKNLVIYARQGSKNAFVPESGFRVGCAAADADRRVLVGANVEHPDWSLILCAERVVLAAARAFGMGTLESIAVSCNGGEGCTPCGACRQVLQELAPDAVLWMDRGGHPPVRASLSSLLPGAFTGGDVLGETPGS